MAFQDILDAIIAESNAVIDAARTKHNDAVAARKQQARDAKDAAHANAMELVEQKKVQLQQKAANHADMLVKSATLKQKQQCINDVYDAVLTQLGSLPKDKLEKLLKACLERLPKKGTLHPSKAHKDMLTSLASGYDVGDAIDASGGFLFTSDTQEYNFTFEHLVTTVVRPQTEIETATTLFA